MSIQLQIAEIMAAMQNCIDMLHSLQERVSDYESERGYESCSSTDEEVPLTPFPSPPVLTRQTALVSIPIISQNAFSSS